jgi:hypothetical protein
LLLLLIAGAAAVALVLTLLWAAALLAVLGLVLWLNVGILPGLAWRVGVSRWVLDLLVLVALCAGGWLVSGVGGTTAGALVWLAGIGAPRAAGVWLRRRVRMHGASHGMIIEGVGHPHPDASHHSAHLPGRSSE